MEEAAAFGEPGQAPVKLGIVTLLAEQLFHDFDAVLQCPDGIGAQAAVN